MFITTVTPKGQPDAAPQFRLHRDNCKSLNGTQVTVDEMLETNPQAVADATPHSVCSPSKAATFSVNRQGADVVAKAAAKAAPKTPRNTNKEKKMSDTATETTEPKAPRTLADTEGTKKCEVCGKKLPLTAFPTRAAKPGEKPERGKVCRADLRAARDAKKAAGSTEG